MNFSFLKERPEYALFADACIEAEKTLRTSAAMCAIGCRKALELAVKWVYAADTSIEMPYRDNLSSLVHGETFRASVNGVTWRKLPFIIKLGNQSVHTERKVSAQDAMISLRSLFEFVQWIDYRYGGARFISRKFDEREVPAVKLALDIRAIKEREALLAQKDEEIKRLEAQICEQQEKFSAAKQEEGEGDSFDPDTLLEWETRKRFIDRDLDYSGWDLDRYVVAEYDTSGMPNSQGIGKVDYVLKNKGDRPLAIVEAKRTMYDPIKGLQQARLYADCLKEELGYRPFIFLSNGFETRFCDDESSPERSCSGVFSQDDLQRLMDRRNLRLPLSNIQVNKNISGRYYQIEAIKAICEKMEEGQRKHLLVMATGTGKTRTAAGLVDVLVRANWVTNVLFLADRVALVSQAKHAFQEYLPNMSLCNLCEARDREANKDARIVFSTYPTALNAIDEVKGDDGKRLFSPAHFDLIIVDEAHRSIFKKYRAIFDYFDSQLVGLTATPKDEVDRNTYDFFEVQRGVPTYVYEYETAVEQDHYLVPYYSIEAKTKFLDEGITYDDLSDEDKERYDEDWEDATGGSAPAFIPSSRINNWVFNEETIDTVLQDLMENGIKVAGGECLGKTIIFAQNKRHAAEIVKRFNKLYPKLATGGFIKRVVHGDDYSHTIIDEFKVKQKPVITVSVDMMDTGVDVPEVLNLVFFKQVRSKIKFWQMIGRGTRLCPDIYASDLLDGEYKDKRRFLIFDYCKNFDFFRQDKRVAEGKNPASRSEIIFGQQALLAKALQQAAFSDEEHQALRSEIANEMLALVCELKDGPLKAAVKLKLHAVEKFSVLKAFECLGDGDVAELQRDLAPLVHIDDEDEYALRFDATMYGYMAAVALGAQSGAYRSRVLNTANALKEKATIPQVKAELPYIDRVCQDGYLERASVVALNEVRQRLRGLIKFLVGGSELPPVITRLNDPVLERKEGETLNPSEDFENYRLKVNRYIAEHGDTLVIHKLRNNKPMTEQEFGQLAAIFTEELGTATDYHAAYGDTPFGLLIRKIAKLDHGAVMEAFADFMNDEGLNQQQINFLHRVIDYIETNGYMEAADLAKAPFDRPVSFVRLFDGSRSKRLVALINQIKSNAEVPAA